jgi:hypothetical protein
VGRDGRDGKRVYLKHDPEQGKRPAIDPTSIVPFFGEKDVTIPMIDAIVMLAAMPNIVCKRCAISLQYTG